MFVVDDLLVGAIVSAIVASAAGAGGAGMLASGSGKKIYTNNKGTKFYKDGGIQGVDPVGTVGHDIRGYPVDNVGRRIVSDDSIFERMNLSSYDIVNLGKSVVDSIPQLIGTTASKSPLVSTDSISNIKKLVGKLQKDPNFIKKVVETAFKPLEGMDGADISKYFIDHPEDIIDIISRDDGNRQKILDALKPIDPKFALISYNPYKPDIHDDIRPVNPYIPVPLDTLPSSGGVKSLPIPPDSTPYSTNPDIQKIYEDALKKIQDDIAKSRGGNSTSTSSTSTTSGDSETKVDTKTDPVPTGPITDTTKGPKEDKKEDRDKEPKPRGPEIKPDVADKDSQVKIK
jgi:hypothetical protein